MTQPRPRSLHYVFICNINIDEPNNFKIQPNTTPSEFSLLGKMPRRNDLESVDGLNDVTGTLEKHLFP